MTLLGLSFAQLAALFGAAGALVTVLYVLKLRRRRVHVPFAKLWLRVLKDRESTSLFRRLRQLLSLLLQLALLALLAFALGDPRLSESVVSGRTIILLLDASASMQTEDQPEGTRMAAALARTRQIVRGLGGADSLMLVRMDAQVAPLSPFSADEKVLLKALDATRASDTHADLARALKFSADALRGRDNPLLILVGDGAYDQRVLDAMRLADRLAPAAASEKKATGQRKPRAVNLDALDLRGVDVRYVPVGRARANVGIVAFNARRYKANKLSFELFLEVVRTPAGPRDPLGAAAGAAAGKADPEKEPPPLAVDLQLLIDGVVTDVQRLSLKPGERAQLSCGSGDDGGARKRWCDLAASGELLEARLVRAGSVAKEDRAQRLDAFPLDDRAFALLPRRRKQRVLLVGRSNLFLEGAMLLDENIAHTRIDPASYSVAALKGYDAVAFDGFYPKEPPPLPALVFNPPFDPRAKGPQGAFGISGMLKGPLITEQLSSHPVMRWITLKDVNIGAALTFSRRPGDAVLASSFRQPVIIAREGKTRSVVVGFDPRRSDLPMRVAFPMLVLNSFHWFSGEEDELLATHRTGQTWPIPLAQHGLRLPPTVTHLDGRDPEQRPLRAPVQRGRALLFGDRAGVYTLRHGDARLRVAANLADAEESDIRPRDKLLAAGGTALRAPEGFATGMRRQIWIYLLLFALALTIVEWLTYNRRVTV